MTPERWSRVKAIFQDAAERDPAARAAFLDAACGPDAEVRAAVDRLLAAHDRADGFLDTPIGVERGLLDGVPTDDPRPAQIGPYRVIRELGRGGMGTVYLADRDDPDLKRTVAIKVVNVASRAIVQRFRTEVGVLAGLEHPGIARLYDAGATAAGVPYLVMEFIDGTDLLTFCDRTHAPVSQRLRLFVRVCAAVQYAHQNFVVHRDLKPSNILVTGDGDPKLLDFGIAKLLSAGGGEDETAMFARALTPQYSSPEHVRGDVVTAASDVYSLGIVLYELLAGSRPYRVEARTPAELERVITEQEPARPSAATATPEIAGARATTVDRLHSTLQGDLDNIVLKALQKDPQRRYATAADFAEDIERHLRGYPVHARANTFGYRAAKFLRRHRGPVAAATLAAASLVAGLGLAVWQAHAARIERDRARLETDKARQMATFLSGMFQSANPAATRDKTVTARDLLDRGTASIETGLQTSPEVQASLLLVMSDAYFRLDAGDKGLELAQRALALRERLFPEDSVEVAEAMYSVGILQRRLGHAALALPLLERALAVHDKRLGPDDDGVVPMLSAVALTREALGQNDGTQELMQRAIAIGERRFPRTAKLALVYNNLATLLHRRGDLDAARDAYEHSIANYKASNEPQNWGIAMPLLNLGSLQRDDENLAAAEPLFAQALEIDDARFGKESLASAYSLACLGDLARARGDTARAHELLQHSLAIYDRSAGPDYQGVADAERYLGETLLDEGRTKEAVVHFERAVRVSEHNHGKVHQAVAVNLVGLARGRDREGALAEAGALLERALAIQQKVLAPTHRDRVPTLTHLGSVRLRQHRLDEARALLAEAVKLAEQLPVHHSYRVAAETAQRDVAATEASRQP